MGELQLEYLDPFFDSINEQLAQNRDIKETVDQIKPILKEEAKLERALLALVKVFPVTEDDAYRRFIAEKQRNGTDLGYITLTAVYAAAGGDVNKGYLPMIFDKLELEQSHELYSILKSLDIVNKADFLSYLISNDMADFALSFVKKHTAKADSLMGAIFNMPLDEKANEELRALYKRQEDGPIMVYDPRDLHTGLCMGFALSQINVCIDHILTAYLVTKSKQSYEVRDHFSQEYRKPSMSLSSILGS